MANDNVRYIERPEPAPEESGWTKWWNSNKPQSRGSATIKIVDHLTVDERVALAELRRLGEAGELDAEATTYEELAKGKRGLANARRMMETYPHLFPPETPPPPAMSSMLLMLLSGLTLVAIIALASLQYRATRPTLSAERGAESASSTPREAQEVSAQPQKGRRAHGHD